MLCLNYLTRGPPAPTGEAKKYVQKWLGYVLFNRAKTFNFGTYFIRLRTLGVFGGAA